jgi:hypothetical protein
MSTVFSFPTQEFIIGLLNISLSIPLYHLRVIFHLVTTFHDRHLSNNINANISFILKYDNLTTPLHFQRLYIATVVRVVHVINGLKGSGNGLFQCIMIFARRE